MIKKRSLILKSYILPAIGGMLGTSLYVLGDTLLVGRRLGSAGLAALNIAIPLINVLTGFGLLIGIGGAGLMVISRMQKDKKSHQLFTQAMILSLFIGVLLLILSLFFTRPLVTLLGSGSSHLDMAYAYLRVLLLFSPFFLLFVSLGVFIRNDGNAKLVMVAMLSASVINLVLDYVFMYPLNMGMRGGALATGLAQVIGFLILLIHFLGDHDLILTPFKSIRAFFSILKQGIASFVLEISQGIVIFSFNIAFLFLASDTLVSAYGIVANLSLLFTAILSGVALGIQPLISQAYGKKREDMIKYYGKIGLMTAIIIGVSILLVGQLIPKYLAMIFITAPDVIDHAIGGIRLYFLAFPLTAINLVFTVYLQSQKQTLKAFLLSLQRGLVWIIVLLLIYSNTLGVNGFGW